MCVSVLCTSGFHQLFFTWVFLVAAAPHHKPTTKHESMSTKQTQNATISPRIIIERHARTPYVHGASSLFTTLRVKRDGRASETFREEDHHLPGDQGDVLPPPHTKHQPTTLFRNLPHSFTHALLSFRCTHRACACLSCPGGQTDHHPSSPSSSFSSSSCCSASS